MGNQTRLWDSDGTGAPNVVSASYSTSWSMTLTATNTVSSFGTGEFAAIGFEVFNDNNSYSAFMLNGNEFGTGVRAEGTGFSTSALNLGDTTDVLLRLSWDATAHTLIGAYSLDGSNFTTTATFHPATEWNNAGGGSLTSGFNFAVFGNSNMAAAISVGSMYADNFSVSAVPEPSTYAAIAGLGALGLAAWRRRQR